MTTIARCLRCGTQFERRSPDQIHCIPCSTEVAALIAADARRHVVRFPHAKSLDRFGRAA